MSGKEDHQKDLINFAFAEFASAINEAKSGRPPVRAYEKLKQVYDTLSEAERKRENKEITDEELQAKMAEQVEKLKAEI